MTTRLDLPIFRATSDGSAAGAFRVGGARCCCRCCIWSTGLS